MVARMWDENVDGIGVEVFDVVWMGIGEEIR